MSSGQLVGAVLVLTGVLDLIMAFLVVGPRLPEERRRVVQMAMVVGSVVLLALGIVFLSGLVGGGSRA